MNIGVTLLTVALALVTAICTAGAAASASGEGAQSAACPECHSVPVFAGENEVHDRHPRIDCSVCHPVDTDEADLTACATCHSVPSYRSLPAVHDTHASLDCGRCHGQVAASGTVEAFHGGLEWAGTGAFILVLAGIAISFALGNRKKERLDGTGHRP